MWSTWFSPLGLVPSARPPWIGPHGLALSDQLLPLSPHHSAPSDRPPQIGPSDGPSPSVLLVRPSVHLSWPSHLARPFLFGPLGTAPLDPTLSQIPIPSTSTSTSARRGAAPLATSQLGSLLLSYLCCSISTSSFPTVHWPFQLRGPSSNEAHNPACSPREQ